MIFILLSILSYVLCNNVPTNSSCAFETKEGYMFDLTTLHRKHGYYEVRDDNTDSTFFALSYVFNICGDHPRFCQNLPASYEVINVLGQLTDSCELIGRPESKVVTLADPRNPRSGVVMKYSKGSVCEDSEKAHEIGQERSVSFLVNCGEDSSQQFRRDESSTKCNLRYKLKGKKNNKIRFCIESPAGCLIPQKSSLSMSIPKEYESYFFLVIAVFGGSIILGLIYRSIKNSEDSLFGFAKKGIFVIKIRPIKDHQFQPIQEEQQDDPELGQNKEKSQ